eukprot:340523-Pleurochrysis_carterae.AAC.5
MPAVAPCPWAFSHRCRCRSALSIASCFTQIADSRTDFHTRRSRKNTGYPVTKIDLGSGAIQVKHQ